MKIEKYVHHDKEVSVISKVKGKHRDMCLCFANCKFFKPDEFDNCNLAKRLYETCVLGGLVTPVFECHFYAPIEDVK